MILMVNVILVPVMEILKAMWKKRREKEREGQDVMMQTANHDALQPWQDPPKPNVCQSSSTINCLWGSPSSAHHLKPLQK